MELGLHPVACILNAMPNPHRAVFQLDFDGTLVEGDASTGILSRFAGAVWPQRIEAASRAMRTQPGTPLLLQAMSQGYAALTGSREDQLAYARDAHPARPGLPQLITATESLGIACHIVSYGFEFYILDYLRAAGVADHVVVHAGHDAGHGLVYDDPEGHAASGNFKRDWTRHLRQRYGHLLYAGDGTSDIAAAELADTVYARDALLTGLTGTAYAGAIHPFESLHDIVATLRKD